MNSSRISNAYLTSTSIRNIAQRSFHSVEILGSNTLFLYKNIRALLSLIVGGVITGGGRGERTFLGKS